MKPSFGDLHFELRVAECASALDTLFCCLTQRALLLDLEVDRDGHSKAVIERNVAPMSIVLRTP